MRKALIIGIMGQDGAYLAKLLKDQGYDVYGIARRSSSVNDWRLRHLLGDVGFQTLRIYYGDILDHAFLMRIVAHGFHEIYNLAAQSDVAVSFEAADYTTQVNAIGPLRVLEAVLAISPDTKVYQASTSEMFGAAFPPQHEDTLMIPQSPYAAAKLTAHNFVRMYRTAYNMFAVSGILFNHESPLRGMDFVTRKITHGVAQIAAGKQPFITLGNLTAKRDWGHAEDYVRGMWLMMQQPTPQDYVLATGSMYSVKEFVTEAFVAAHMPINWVSETWAVDAETKATRVKTSSQYLRPLEVNALKGDATRAEYNLGWKRTHSFRSLVSDMVNADFIRAGLQPPASN